VDIKSRAVDANIMVAAMMGGGTRDLVVRIRSAGVDLSTPEEVYFEVQDKLVDLAAFSRTRIDLFRLALSSMPLGRVSKETCQKHMKQAEMLIGRRDPDDAPIIALALATNIPIWSNDKDLKSVKQVRTFTTAELRPLFP
jgi:predicted nucleic acid-binding protein